jgi:hypothetical protein
MATGLRHLNLSLDSLSARRYREITGSDRFSRVVAGLWRAAELGFDPLKVNCVVLKGINDDEILDFALLARDHPIQVRFIEFMPTVSRELWASTFCPWTRCAGASWPWESWKRWPPGPPPARPTFSIPRGFRGPSASSRRFPAPLPDLQPPAPHRGRRLRPCLFAPQELDLKGPLRQGAGDAGTLPPLPSGHGAENLLPPTHLLNPDRPASPMVSIGG